MTTDAAALTTTKPPATRPAGLTIPSRWRPVIGVAAMAGGVAAAFMGDVAGVVGALVAVAAAATWRPRAAPDRSAVAAVAGPAGDGDAGSAARSGAALLVTSVVPVWQRQVLASRDVADQGLAQLLEAFNGFSSAIDELARQVGDAALGAGTPGGALEAEHPALAALLAPSRRAFADRDAAVAALGTCADGLAQLQQHAKRCREIARHTRLVAFNAAIEAQRHGGEARGAVGGQQAVAVEVRMLAGRMAESAEQIDRLVAALHRCVAEARRSGEIADTSEEELRIEIGMRAREALAALAAAVGASLHGSSAVQQVGAQLRAKVDEAFVHFQFGDRVSQMLAILANDMAHLVKRVQADPHATQSDAAEWLAALEASYTMEEQRSQHHGNVHVDRGSTVEFF
ncbi:MAG: methyl-accepting chemotaxis protein [Rubrivivax sp.]|jgi:methyl-accepting chemotaxis protein|nr:methyl-accepting chemotaxis protein [Rubrivivax sp.]